MMANVVAVLIGMVIVGGAFDVLAELTPWEFLTGLAVVALILYLV